MTTTYVIEVRDKRGEWWEIQRRLYARNAYPEAASISRRHGVTTRVARRG